MIKTRFSPSPTGHLHIGGARTALFAWLYAKRHQGVFYLRIEDTDTERSRDEYTQAILKAMDWLALDFEGAPVYQSKRFDRYHEVALALQAKGHVYRCTCSKERLDDLRQEQQSAGEKPRYDGHCRDLSIDFNEQGVLRFKTPQSGEVSFHDGVHGNITVANAELDDLILVRSDGVPTYNFTVVVDDADMGITHILRGDDHINNTPRQIHLYEAMGWSVPTFCHMPMILGQDGKRLSKRHGAMSVLEYQAKGYLPHALLNYLARLGWSHGDQEIFTREELIALFDLEHLSHSPGMFDPEKLKWVNQVTLQGMSADDLLPMVEAQLKVTDGPPLSAVIDLIKDRCQTIQDMVEMASFWYQDEVIYDEALVAKHCDDAARPILRRLHDVLASLQDWQPESIKQSLKLIAKEQACKFGEVALPLRVAVTGNTASPSLDQTVFLLGQAKVAARLEAILDRLA